MSNIYKRLSAEDKKIKLTQESFGNSNGKWLNGKVNDIDNVVSVDIPDEVKEEPVPEPVEAPITETPVANKKIEISTFLSGKGIIDNNVDLFSFIDANLSLKYINVRALKIKPDMIKNLDNNYSGKIIPLPVGEEEPVSEGVPAPTAEVAVNNDEVAMPVDLENTVFPPLGSIVKEEKEEKEIEVPEFTEDSESTDTNLIGPEDIQQEDKIVEEAVEETVEEPVEEVVEVPVEEVKEEVKEESSSVPYSDTSIPEGRLFVTEEVETPAPEEKAEIVEPKEEPKEENPLVADYLGALKKLRDEADSLKAKAEETKENAEKVKEDAKNKAEAIKEMVEKEKEKLRKEMEETQQIIDKNNEEIAKGEKELEDYTKTQSELEVLLGVKAD